MDCTKLCNVEFFNFLSFSDIGFRIPFQFLFPFPFPFPFSDSGFHILVLPGTTKEKTSTRDCGSQRTSLSTAKATPTTRDRGTEEQEILISEAL